MHRGGLHINSNFASTRLTGQNDKKLSDSSLPFDQLPVEVNRETYIKSGFKNIHAHGLVLLVSVCFLIRTTLLIDKQ